MNAANGAERPQPMLRPEALLTVRGLVTRFDGRIIHNGLDFSIGAGELIALFGGSGTGKSTFLRALIGLERPDAGQIELGGKDFAALDAEGWRVWRRRIGYVFQNGALFDSLTVGQNLDYPLAEFTDMNAAARKEAVETMLGRVGLPEAQALYPAMLSGGMQKRVGLARTLMLDPELVLYDEPTAGLDPANTRKIEELMLTLKSEGKAGILVTHDVPCALRTADRICFLEHGKIVAEQGREELEKNPDPRIASYIRGEIE